MFGRSQSKGRSGSCSRNFQQAMSVQSHDASQSAQGFLCLLGGLLITFAKEILGPSWDAFSVISYLLQREYAGSPAGHPGFVPLK